MPRTTKINKVVANVMLFLLLINAVSSQSSIVDMFEKWKEKREGRNTSVPRRPEPCQVRLNRATTSVFNPKNFLPEIGLLMETYYNWGELLAPAPVAIGIIGQLILMSNQRMDFPININPPRLGFKHIEYPDSFRTTLIQISQRGSSAFLKAHINMNTIKLYNLNIPVDVEAVVRYLKSKNKKVISLRLVPALDRIKEAADRSKTLSEEVVIQFQSALNLIQETILAVTATKSGKKEEFKKVMGRINATIAAETVSKNETELLEAKNSNIDTMLRKVHKRQQDLFVKITYPECNKYAQDYNRHSESKHLSKERKMAIEGRLHPELIFQAGNWHYTFEENRWNADSCLEENNQNLVQLMTAAKQYYLKCEALRKEIKSTSTLTIFEVSEEIEELHRPCKAIENCQTLSRLSNTCHELVKSIQNENRKVFVKTDDCPGANEMEEMLILIADHRAAKIKDSYKVKTIVLQNIKDIKEAYNYVHRHQKEMINEIGKTAKTMIDLNNKKLQENQYRMEEILKDLNGWKSTSLTYKEAIEVLENGLSHLNQLKQSWDKLVEFFTRIGTLTYKAAEASYSFIYFTSPYSLTTAKRDEVSFYEDLTNHAEKANAASLVVAHLASIYDRVSDRYILPRMSSLSRLQSLDMKKIGHQAIEREKQLLLDNSMEAYEGIVQMMKEEEENMIKKLRTKRIEIEDDHNNLEKECFPEKSTTTSRPVSVSTVKPTAAPVYDRDDNQSIDDYEEMDEWDW